MSIEPLHFFVPIKGRFITGDMDKLRTRDHQGKPLDFEKQSYDFGIAFPKQEVWSFLTEQVWPYLSQCYATDAQAMQRLQAWFGAPGLSGAQGGMSMKIGDGDKPNSKGQVSDNAKGHFVFYCTTYGQGADAQPPAVVAGPSAQQLAQIDLSQIKRGDYVTFHGSMKPNGLQGNNFGVYLNCQTVWKLEDGPSIAGGVDPTAAFQGAALAGNFDPSGGVGAAFGAPMAPQAPQGPTPGAAPGLPGMGGAPTAAPTPGGVPQSTASASPYPEILSGPPASLPGQAG